MGLYVRIVPMHGKKELGEKEATPIAFELKAGRESSQDELEQVAWGLEFVVPLIYTERGAAERDASRLGVILAARSSVRLRGRERRQTERRESKRCSIPGVVP